MKLASNPIRVDGDTAYMSLEGGHVAMIDAVDVPLVAPHRWHVQEMKTGHIYARRFESRSEGRHCVLMHRVLLDAPKGKWVDHEDGNGLNNKRSTNIRICSPAQNMANKAAQKNNALGIKGVVLLENGLYKTSIKSDGKTIYIGSFQTGAEANAAYFGAARMLWREFAKK